MNGSKKTETLRITPMVVNVNGHSTQMTSPTPSSTATSYNPNVPKMNGSLHQRHHAGIFNTLNSSRNGQTPTKPMFDLSSRDLFNQSIHDTSHDLSRSVLSSGSRLRSPLNVTTTGSPAVVNPATVRSLPGSPVNASPASGSSSPPYLAGPTSTNPGTGSAAGAVVTGGGHGSSLPEFLASLGLLSILSLLMAFLAVLFLMEIMSPVATADGRPGPAPGLCNLSAFNSRIVDASEYRLVYEVVVGLTTCTISLDFTCLLICCAQFIFASKLTKAPQGRERAMQFLCQSSCTRVIAMGGFFISIPLLLTAIILYAFIQFESKSAIITSSFLGLSIIFCGVAMIHNVYAWQREKTKASTASRNVGSVQASSNVKVQTSESEQSTNQGLDVTQNASLELSTLV